MRNEWAKGVLVLCTDTGCEVHEMISSQALLFLRSFFSGVERRIIHSYASSSSHRTLFPLLASHSLLDYRLARSHLPGISGPNLLSLCVTSRVTAF